ncbi:conserved Plasmodium protein, unknown function [Plasmodium malariae]|uniref:BTB domain-containing protein n=1 Tax=Plasmodium malariae TaxID=5858 RepID=A0A1A8W6U3_PLAMA|nr:conserved Plasmodium protein, unknown function [Plasmodium malariae]SBS88527.1 conserved Plasmodium protein, unknown function [Plasmodium malariae]SCO93971.1 conserved Plasmodium protein, unknown function [Plasmodium malariae]
MNSPLVNTNFEDSGFHVPLFKRNKEKAKTFTNKNMSRNILTWNKLICSPNNDIKKYKKFDSDSTSKNNSHKELVRNAYFPRRSGAASVLYKNYIYIFGGYGSKGKRLNDFYKYNILENKWTEIYDKKCPSRRENNPAFLYKDKMYILGGYQGKGIWLNDFYFFDMNTEKWEMVKIKEQSNMYAPPSLFGFSLAVHEYTGILYLFGGYDGITLHNKMYAFHLYKEKWIHIKQSGDIPSPRACTIGHIYDGYFYTFGGYKEEIEEDDDDLNYFYQYHLETGIWTKMKYNINETTIRNHFLNNKKDINGIDCCCYYSKRRIPMARYFMGSFIYNECIYIIGGYNIHSSERLNDFYKFDIKQRIWEKILTRNNFSKRSSMNIQFYKNVIYCIAGFDGKNSLNDVYALRLENVYVESSSLTQTFACMVNNYKYSDIILMVQKRYIYACRSILSARCSSFKSLFDLHFSKDRTTGGSPPYNHHLIIPINDVQYDIFLIIINYLYTDELSLNYSLKTYEKILVTCTKFHIFRLMQLCERIISNHTNEQNVLNILLLSYRNNCKQLCKFCIDFITDNKLMDHEKINRLITEPHLLGEIYKKSLFI